MPVFDRIRPPSVTLAHMDARQADLLRKIEPAELGHRLRAARVAKGMTQTDLAGDDVSVGYVSRIESGHRRPNLQVLTDLCVRLGTPVEALLMGVAPQELERIELEPRLRRAVAGVGRARRPPRLKPVEAPERPKAPRSRSWPTGGFLVARALEAQGLVDDAIIELETILPACRHRAADQGRHRPEPLLPGDRRLRPRPSRSAR